MDQKITSPTTKTAKELMDDSNFSNEGRGIAQIQEAQVLTSFMLMDESDSEKIQEAQVLSSSTFMDESDSEGGFTAKIQEAQASTFPTTKTTKELMETTKSNAKTAVLVDKSKKKGQTEEGKQPTKKTTRSSNAKTAALVDKSKKKGQTEEEK